MFSVAATLGLTFLLANGEVEHRAALDFAVLEADAGCPGADEVQRAVARRLGYWPWVEDPEVIINGVLSGGPGTYSLHLAMLDADGEVVGQRDVASTARDCHEISEALILDLCMAIDPQATLRPVPDEKVILRRPRRPPPVWQASAPAPSPRDIPWGTSAWAHSVLTLGTSPSLSGGVHAGGLLHWGVFGVGGEVGSGWPSLMPVDGGRVGTQLTTFTALGCMQDGWFQACATGGAGTVVALAEELQQARRVTRPYFSVGTRLALVVPVLPWLNLHTGLDGAVVLNRIRLTDSISGRAYWTMPPGNLSYFAGMGVSWP
jgi:hypothetical protein